MCSPIARAHWTYAFPDCARRYTPEQKREVSAAVKAWLLAAPGSPEDKIEFDSVRRMDEILAQVRARTRHARGPPHTHVYP